MLKEVFARAEGRVVITSFASNVHRLQQVIDAAVALDRRVAVVGRSMRKNLNIARQLGHAQVPEGLLVSPKEIESFPDERLVLLTTGSQGEPLSALRRMAHRRAPSGEAALRRHDHLLGHADPGQRARGERDGGPPLPDRRHRDHDAGRSRCTRPATAGPRSSS